MPLNIGVIRVFNNVAITSTSPMQSELIRPVDSGYFSAYVSSTAAGTLSLYASMDNINFVNVAITLASSTLAIASGTANIYTLQPVLAPYYYFSFAPSSATGTLTLIYASF